MNYARNPGGKVYKKDHKNGSFGHIQAKPEKSLHMSTFQVKLKRIRETNGFCCC